MPSTIAAAVFALATTIAIGSANAQTTHTTSPGKTTLHISTNAVAVSAGSDTVLLSGDIKRGKPGRVLVVDAFVGSLAAGENGIFWPRVNGVALDPTDDFGAPNAMGINSPATATRTCTGSGHWWLDLDTAEAASPGDVRRPGAHDRARRQRRRPARRRGEPVGTPREEVADART